LAIVVGVLLVLATVAERLVGPRVRMRFSRRARAVVAVCGSALVLLGMLEVSGVAPSPLPRAGGDGASTAAMRWPSSRKPPGFVGNPPVGHPLQGHQGRVLDFRVDGQASGLVGDVNVVLPPDYASRNRTQRYPVIEVFAGYRGDQLSWIDGMSLPDFVDQAVAAGRLGESVIVSPQVEFPQGRDGECSNGRAGDPQLETWLTEDVPAWADKEFRVQQTRSGWATMGLSMGGFCAAMAAMRHPDHYATAIVFGGYFSIDYGSAYRPWTASDPEWRYYDLIALSRNGDLPPLQMWIETSRADPESYPSTMSFLQQVHSPISVTAVVRPAIPHNWRIWRQMLPECLTWLGSRVPDFKPGPRPA
jgi:pimeloyl-ACP methyl ester carboxylesterase